MKIKQAIIKAYTDAFGLKQLDPESVRQLDPLSFAAITAVFGTFQEFIVALADEKPVVETKKVKATPKKVAK